MKNPKLIAVILIGLMVVKSEGSIKCYASCFVAVGATGVVAGPAAIAVLGFTPTGIVAGSWAAWWMSLYGGKVAAGSLFAALQAVGATGAMKWTGIPYAKAVCDYLCHEE